METYLDERGYLRFKENKKLVHRWVAYDMLYMPYSNLYSLPFREYDVHHKDGDKGNNRKSNLEILTREEHELAHNILESEGLPDEFLTAEFREKRRRFLEEREKREKAMSEINSRMKDIPFGTDYSKDFNPEDLGEPPF